MPLIGKGKIKKHKRLKVKYKKQKCSYHSGKERCGQNAVGKSTLCEKHGGLRYDPELALSVKDTMDAVSELGQIKFKPEIHPIAYIELSAAGKSPVEIAAEFLVSKNTLDNWAERYKEFQTAFEVGKVLHESWWLAQGKNGLNLRGFNTTLYKFLTGNKLGYSDKSESKNLNINQNIHGVLVASPKLSDSEWEAEGLEGDVDG